MSRVTTSKTTLQYSCSTAEQAGVGDVDVCAGCLPSTVDWYLAVAAAYSPVPRVGLGRGASRVEGGLRNDRLPRASAAGLKVGRGSLGLCIVMGEIEVV